MRRNQGSSSVGYEGLAGPTTFRMATADYEFVVKPDGKGLFVQVPYYNLTIEHGLVVSADGPFTKEWRIQ